ncbi:hypothetical protein GSI_05490 [Ganoderma sinense ZZ0214-1]|uniref:Uncharacterized protein n=1 Tax=Ganoderma sinense ZZ0214-1 TaxID=1077348 RepID=A0A2G8SEP5_9APHY|nr:hypothetical protein GSI_05490 [Ganoderma sinense ZZ0214-1]
MPPPLARRGTLFLDDNVVRESPSQTDDWKTLNVNRRRFSYVLQPPRSTTGDSSNNGLEHFPHHEIDSDDESDADVYYDPDYMMEEGASAGQEVPSTREKTLLRSDSQEHELILADESSRAVPPGFELRGPVGAADSPALPPPSEIEPGVASPADSTIGSGVPFISFKNRGGKMRGLAGFMSSSTSQESPSMPMITPQWERAMSAPPATKWGWSVPPRSPLRPCPLRPGQLTSGASVVAGPSSKSSQSTEAPSSSDHGVAGTAMSKAPLSRHRASGSSALVEGCAQSPHPQSSYLSVPPSSRAVVGSSSNSSLQPSSSSASVVTTPSVSSEASSPSDRLATTEFFSIPTASVSSVMNDMAQTEPISPLSLPVAEASAHPDDNTQTASGSRPSPSSSHAAGFSRPPLPAVSQTNVVRSDARHPDRRNTLAVSMPGGTPAKPAHVLVTHATKDALDMEDDWSSYCDYKEMRDDKGQTVWYQTCGPFPLDSPPSSLRVAVDTVYIHYDDCTSRSKMWVMNHSSVWVSVRSGDRQPSDPERRLSISKNGDPSWITKASWSVYRSRLKRARRIQQGQRTIALIFSAEKKRQVDEESDQTESLANGGSEQTNVEDVERGDRRVKPMPARRHIPNPENAALSIADIGSSHESEATPQRDQFAKRNKKRRFLPPEINGVLETMMPGLKAGDLNKLSMSVLNLLEEYGFDFDALDDEMEDVDVEEENEGMEGIDAEEEDEVDGYLLEDQGMTSEVRRV